MKTVCVIRMEGLLQLSIIIEDLLVLSGQLLRMELFEWTEESMVEFNPNGRGNRFKSGVAVAIQPP